MNSIQGLLKFDWMATARKEANDPGSDTISLSTSVDEMTRTLL